MATALTKTVVRKVQTKRGPRIVELTPIGVVVRVPRKQRTPLPVPMEAIEDLGLKMLAQAEGKKKGWNVPRPRPRR